MSFCALVKAYSEMFYYKKKTAIRFRILRGKMGQSLMFSRNYHHRQHRLVDNEDKWMKGKLWSTGHAFKPHRSGAVVLAVKDLCDDLLHLEDLTSSKRVNSKAENCDLNPGSRKPWSRSGQSSPVSHQSYVPAHSEMNMRRTNKLSDISRLHFYDLKGVS